MVSRKPITLGNKDIKRIKKEFEIFIKNVEKENQIKSAIKKFKEDEKKKQKIDAMLRARKGLTFNIPSFEEHKNFDASCKQLDGFTSVEDFELFQKVYNVIGNSKKINEILSGMKRALNCHRNEFVIVGFRNYKDFPVKGSTSQDMTLFCRHNPNLHGNFAGLVFDPTRKLWTTKTDGNGVSGFGHMLSKFFKYVVDSGTMTIYINNKEPIYKVIVEPAFKPMSIYVEKNIHDILVAIKKYRPDDDFLSNFSIHNGEKFEKIKNFDAVIHTNSPFLFVRYSSKSQSTHLVLSSISAGVEEIIYGGSYGWEYCAQFTARYLEACEEGDMQINFQNRDSQENTQQDVRSLNDDFRRFDERIKNIKSLFADMEFSLLFLDYSVLPDIYIETDPDLIGTFACIPKPNRFSRTDMVPYLKELATYFDYNNKCFPIIFIREKLLSWETEDSCFSNAVIHVLAHWIAFEHALDKDGLVDKAILYAIRSIMHFSFYDIKGTNSDLDKTTAHSLCHENDVTKMRERIIGLVDKFGFLPAKEIVILARELNYTEKHS